MSVRAATLLASLKFVYRAQTLYHFVCFYLSDGGINFARKRMNKSEEENIVG